VAGAVVVALRGTTYGLFGIYGDAGVVVGWARMLADTGEMPWSYPPGFIHAMAWYSELSGSTPEHSLKVMQIAGTALFGPVAYLAWRLVLRPMWALVLGVVPSMVLIEPYKVYANLMLVVLVPVLLFLLQRLRKADQLTYREIVVRGIGIGAVIGVVFLIYSGWFVWSAPGVVVAALVVFPWRTGLWRGLTLVAVTTATFVAVSFIHLYNIISASSGMTDRYFYFDVYAEPAYIAMTRGDMPGALPGPWPPPGELGGVGVFTIIALVGVAAAIAVGRNRTAIILLTSLFAGAWVIRFYYASTMYERDAVQLYPRSSSELLYSMLLLCGFALYFGVQRLEGVPKLRPWIAARSLRIAALAGMFVLMAMAGSAIGDRYMPRWDDSLGILALASHLITQPDGTCSAYVRTLNVQCVTDYMDYRALLPGLRENAPRPGELQHKPRG
jgi:galactan 5-O-arabinofuranosyltransferase